jgi:hypothetical protein
MVWSTPDRGKSSEKTAAESNSVWPFGTYREAGANGPTSKYSSYKQSDNTISDGKKFIQWSRPPSREKNDSKSWNIFSRIGKLFK